MEVHSFFLMLLAILLSARILGELAAGVLLGPSLLGWVEPLPVIRLLAEIGIILLLFEVGLETDVMRLVKTGVKSAVVALAGFVLPFVFGFSLSYWGFGQSLLVALFIGGTLTATSIGITVRVLTDLNRHQCSEAQIVLGAAVLDDVMGVVLLAFLFEFSTGGGISLANAGKVLVFVTLFTLLAPFAAKGMAEFVKRFRHMSQMEGLIPTFVISLVLFFAWLAHAVGAPAMLGGFAAGLALSRRFFFPLGIAIRKDPAFAHRIEARMKPIVQLFTPIFFVTVGLSLNFREVDWQSSFVWAFSLLLFVRAVGGKVLGAYLIREGAHARFAIGMANASAVIVGSSRQALRAARDRAVRLRFDTEVVTDTLQGEARDAAVYLAGVATKAQKHLSGGKPRCLVSGGETIVTVKGNGLGGRNQELALAFALEIEGLEGITLLSAGTDGTDGPTDAAGAMVDGKTAAVAKNLGIDPAEYLARNDSYSFFKKLDSLSGKKSHFITGPTGTNVMDIQVVAVNTA